MGVAICSCAIFGTISMAHFIPIMAHRALFESGVMGNNGAVILGIVVGFWQVSWEVM